MILVVEIVLTIFLTITNAFCIWLAIDEIRYFKNWIRLVLTLILLVIGMIDIWILWFM